MLNTVAVGVEVIAFHTALMLAILVLAPFGYFFLPIVPILDFIACAALVEK